MSRFEFRVLLWSWGLMVDVDLSLQATEAKPRHALGVAEGVWLVVSEGVIVWDAAEEYLMRGLRRVAPRLRASLAADCGELVFRLDHLWVQPTDFQDDAVEAAVVGWASEQLGILDEPMTISFDRPGNRYIIEYNEEMWEPAP